MATTDPLLKEWAERVAQIRGHHRLTRSALAKVCGVTEKTVGSWERAEAIPRAKARRTLYAMLAKIEADETVENGAAA